MHGHFWHTPHSTDIHIGLTDQAYEKLFQLVLTRPNTNHVLSSLLSDKTNQHYYRISEQDAMTDNLLTNATKLFSNNFMIRMLHTDCY